jgi:F420-dependent oxidoreductase-like protein
MYPRQIILVSGLNFLKNIFYRRERKSSDSFLGNPEEENFFGVFKARRIRKTKFGYQQPSHTFSGSKTIFQTLKEIAGECEEQGYDSFWIMDHLLQIGFVGSSTEPIMESYTTLSALAAVTNEIHLGALCTCNFFRNPALLAKMGATLDQISEGRFWLGLGAGWFQEEAKAYGYDFQNNRTRLAMLEEAIRIVDMAWTIENPTFRGKYYTIENFVLSPKPVQKPRPPILIGGDGEKITLKLVAKYADACNLFAGGEELRHKLDVLKGHCEGLGRDYSKILKTRLASVMFAESKDEAMRQIEPFKPSWLDMKSYSNGFLLGSPSEITEQVSDLKVMGIDYLIVNFRGKYDPNAKLTFSKDVMSRF